MNELKPCPFCGGPVRWCGNDPNEPHACHQIICEACSVSINFQGAKIHLEPDLDEVKRLSAQAWNKRPLTGVEGGRRVVA